MKRLKKKLEARPCKAEPELHAMGNPKIIERVLALGEFDRPNLLAFCSIAKAWIVPCRVKIFTNRVSGSLPMFFHLLLYVI